MQHRASFSCVVLFSFYISVKALFHSPSYFRSIFLRNQTIRAYHKPKRDNCLIPLELRMVTCLFLNLFETRLNIDWFVRMPCTDLLRELYYPGCGFLSDYETHSCIMTEIVGPFKITHTKKFSFAWRTPVHPNHTNLS